MLTPEQFKEEVKKIKRDYAGDAEARHSKTDDLMEKLLTDLGYDKGIAIIKKMTRWYA